MSLPAAILTGGAAGAAYLDGKYQLRQDLQILAKLKKAEWAYARRVKDDRVAPWYLFSEACKRQPHVRAIWSRECVWTFGALHDQVLRYARWLADQGIRPGDLVGMYLMNQPEFIMLFFAAHCIGAAPALFNYNLEGKALLHCLSICESKLLITDSDQNCQIRIAASQSEIEGQGMKVFTLDNELKRTVSLYPVDEPGHELRQGIQGDFPYCLLYTSGTTGLPKGCPFTTARMHMLGHHIAPPYNTKPGIDCWYSAMPLYHGTAVMACTSALVAGVGIAIAPRFSVSGFWPDVHDSQSTIFIYVGESARYLLNAPMHPLERKHNLRMGYGNGLRPDVWNKLQERFNIPEVLEFFSSSEGVLALAVWDRGPYLQACVGHHGLIMRLMLRNILIPVMIDHETGDIWRDPTTGFAKRMSYDDGGEIIVAVPNREVFGGYWKNQAATDKRFAVDVFKKGDLYYRSGDALRRTSDGHWYFLDRLGDTFRWKSENVSTAEVAEVLGRFPGITEANVYGVAIPNHEGRAGCAALQLDEGASKPVNYNELLQYVRQELPKYAVPVFLRISKASSHIHNHKQNKVPLRKEGIDPALLGSAHPEGKDDIIYWISPGKNDEYVPFNLQSWEAISQGRAKL